MAAITFSGSTTADFPSAACLSDPGGQDVGMPAAFPNTEISGFDIRRVCFSYDPANDTLYLGIQTYEDASNVPIIFGDADGNGFADSAGLVLQTLLGDDLADLGGEEFFTLAIDFNGDGIVDLVAGTHNENNLNAFAVVDGKSAPDNNLLLAPLERFYGDPLPASVSAALAFLPEGDRPHLEFSIAGFSTIAEYAALDLSDPDSFFRLYITTGSFDDDGISEEYFPNIALWRSFSIEALLDNDADAINDLFDTDDDNDTISDLVEKNLSQYDTDGDGFLSEAEATASGLDVDGDGDVDIHDIGSWPDVDQDGIADYLDNDHNNDGIPDNLVVNVNAGPPEGGRPPLNIVSVLLAASASTSDNRLGGDVDLAGGAVRLQGEGCSLIGGGSGIGLWFWWLLMIVWLGIVPKVWALRADHYQTNMEGLGFLNHDRAQVLAPKKFSAGLSTHLMHDPLGFGRNATGQSLDSVVNFFWVWDVWGAYSWQEDWEAAIHFPASIYSQVEGLTDTVERNTASLGDMRLLGKWRFWRQAALIGFLELPTGAAEDFFGEANVTGGVKAVGEHDFGRHTLGGHLGFFGRGPETIRADGLDLLTVHPEMLFGLAWRWPFAAERDWALLGHFWGKSDFQSEATTPMELNFGLQKHAAKIPLAGTLGFGFGLTKGYGTPTYRLIFNLEGVKSHVD